MRGFGLFVRGAVLVAMPLDLIERVYAGDGGSPFTEEAAARGIVYSTGYIGAAGRGLALGDFDNDGDPDLIAGGRVDGVIGVFRNDGGTFTDLSGTCNLPNLSLFSAISAADYDGDGDLDLYVCNWGAANRLLRNDGNWHFTDVTAAAGVADIGGGTAGAWGDYDGDGWLDLYVSNLTRLDLNNVPNRLYRSLGNGSFVEVGAALGVNDPNLTWQGLFVDFDRDSDPDIYSSNDKGAATCAWHNHLWRNDRGVFTDITEASGTEACADSMGVATGDFDGNGHIDLYCTNTPYGNPLLLNQGDGTFVEASVAAGVASFATGWGTVFFDWDNDGILDLYVCNQDAPNRLYHHDVQFPWPCMDLAPGLGCAIGGISYCVVSGDIDGDGDLDLIVQNRQEPLRLLINQEGQKRNWLKLNVVGNGANVNAIGALIDVRVGAITQLREVAAGRTYKSHCDMTVHVGMGTAGVADEVTVRWPHDGGSRTITGLPVNQTWTIYPAWRLGDADGDGDQDLADFQVFDDCYNAGTFLPGCEVMDFDGDCSVDGADLGAFLGVYDGPLLDCNGNQVADILEVLVGAAEDANGDGVLDTCQQAGDLNGSGTVDIDDLIAILTGWGSCPSGETGCPGDANHDGAVDVNDLLVVIVNWS